MPHGVSAPCFSLCPRQVRWLLFGGPTRAQRRENGGPAEGGMPFVGRAGAVERVRPAACGGTRNVELATARGEDEQRSERGLPLAAGRGI